MATISNTPRPGYVWDATDNVWYPIGVGGHSHSEIAKTIADAKGDLIVGTAADTVDRLAVGNNGETLVADSSATTGLRWQGDYAAGKNKIINGDFYINQRAFTSNTTTGTFNFDRWKQFNVGGTFTITPQTFTPGAAPLSGYEGKIYFQGITASQSAAGDYAVISQTIEDVRTFAGQTITVSFWAKAASGTPKIALELGQNFGSGGSASVFTAISTVTISTSWTRYSITTTVPSISGKTLSSGNDTLLEIFLWMSAGSSFASRASSIGIQNNTFQVWGVQVEAGSVATAFQTATGTLQGELAACQRYYQRIVDGASQWIGAISYFQAAFIENVTRFIVQMRTAPSLVITTGTDYYSISRNGGTDTLNSLTIYQATTQSCELYNNTEASGTAGHAGIMFSNNASSSIAFNAEL